MHGTFDSHFDYYQSTPGRRLFALRRVQSRAESYDRPNLAEAIARGLEVNREAGELQGDWRHSRNVDEKSRQKAAEIDNELDRTVGALHTQLKTVRSVFRGTPKGRTAAMILEKNFPDGAAAITRMSFEDQLQAVEYMLDRFNGEWANDLAALEIESLVTHLADVAAAFEDAMADQESREVTWDQVREADNRGQDAMLQVVAVILAEFGGDNEADVEARGQLLGPIIEQNERLGELHKNQRTIPEVDPETGEPEEEMETPLETNADGGSEIDPDADGAPSGDSQPEPEGDGEPETDGHPDA